MKVVFMKSSIYLPPQAFSSSEDSLVVSLIYQTLNEVLRLSKEPDGDPGGVFTANTSIVSSTVSPNPRNVLNKPINIVLENKQVWSLEVRSIIILSSLTMSTEKNFHK